MEKLLGSISALADYVLAGLVVGCVVLLVVGLYNFTGNKRQKKIWATTLMGALILFTLLLIFFDATFYLGS